MARVTKELVINCALIYVSYYSDFRRTMVSAKEVDELRRALETDEEFSKAPGLFTLGEDSENIYFTSLSKEGNYYYILNPNMDFDKIRNDILGRLKYFPVIKALDKNEVLIKIGLAKENGEIKWFE